MKRMVESEFYEPSPLLRELQVLSILAKDPESSQKVIAEEVGLAPSMVHNYIHHLAGKGLIEMQGPSRRRMRYIVTGPGQSRIDTLAGRHLSDAGRMLESFTSDLKSQIDNAARNGVHCLAVIAGPSLARTLSKMAAEAGVEVRPFPSAGVTPEQPSAPFDGIEAVLIAEDSGHADFEDAMRRCKERGLPVYKVA